MSSVRKVFLRIELATSFQFAFRSIVTRFKGPVYLGLQSRRLNEGLPVVRLRLNRW